MFYNIHIALFVTEINGTTVINSTFKGKNRKAQKSLKLLNLAGLRKEL